ncbi:hypothetical protein [Sagittula stellata]|uniref:Leucyl-tRNA synthetase n=1 Tax=Sagittula stellata (strain ATCC 700073 / DSM 11524 / E-37) TaxID=388399 RepID=A3JXV9_SAGS3|nr:hypothetical protein [Sagittula stellata]EBA10345.1 leucyl-tRNA synthetase [Sagittula stellata E-37]
MAHITHESAPRRNVLADMFNGMMEGLARIAESSHRMKELERLQAMSDEQLAKRGLKREDIARHVFRDVMYV